MINLILPIVDDPDKYLPFLGSLAGKDAKVFVGIRKGLTLNLAQNDQKNEKSGKRGRKSAKFENDKKVLDIEIHTFSETAKMEEIINSLHSVNMQRGKVLVCRRPLTDAEFEKLASSSKDIVALKAKHSKFVSFMKKAAEKIVKRFFAFTFFEDISAICFGENMFELMSTIRDLSMASRINRFVGLDIEEVETAERQVKKDYSRWGNISLFLLWTFVLLASVAGGVLVCVFTPLHVLTVILVIFWIFLALFLWFVGLVNFTRTLAVGNLRYGRAEEMTA